MQIITRFALISLLLIVEYVSYVALTVTEPNDWYYAVCGLFNIVYLIILTGFRKSPLMQDLITINYGQLIIQCAGWVLWSFGFDSYAYQGMINFLLIAQVSRILIKTNNDRTFNNQRSAKSDPGWYLVCSDLVLWTISLAKGEA